VANYVHAAVDLRNCIEFNLCDHQYAYKEHGSIQYLFDSNTVRFFLNPIRQLQRVSFSLDIDHSAMIALATVTSEFLFSRGLCGQWGAPALIAPLHAQELERRASELVEILADGGGQQIPDDSLEEKVGEALLQIRRLDHVDASIEKFFESDHDLRRILSDEAYEARMFTRIVEEDLLKPLTSDRNATAEVISPPEADVMWWAQEIARNRPPAAFFKTKQEGKRKTPKNDHADAETIVQLISINRVARESGDMTRYVLVTADQSIHNAMTDWYRSQLQEPNPAIDFYPIRRIGQFIPFLNTAQMPNNITSISLINDIREAVDTLLGGFGVVAEFPLRLPALVSGIGAEEGRPDPNDRIISVARLMEHFGADTKINETISRLGALWSKLARDSVFLNLGLLSRRFHAVSELADFVERSEDVRSAVLAYMDRAVVGVEKAHVEFAIKHRLASAVDRSHALGNGAATRGMLMLRSRFANFTGGRSLYDFLNFIVANPRSDEARMLYASIASSSRHDALLLSGCIAFWASSWESALFFAERARSSAERSRKLDDGNRLEYLEIEYFQAVARRYVAMDLDGSMDERIQMLKGVLEQISMHENNVNDANDSFLVVRASVEKGLTLVTIAYVHSLQDDTDNASALNYIHDAYGCFRSALPALMDFRDQDDKDSIDQMWAEVCIGLAGCILHQFLFGGRLSHTEIGEMGDLAAQVRFRVSQAPELVPELYYLASDLLDVMFEQSADRRAQLVDKATEKMTAARLETANVTRLDRLTLAQVGARLPEATARWIQGG
jgi:hypothetical protein